MPHGSKRCPACGRTEKPQRRGKGATDGICAECGAALDGGALSEFASRLARFGLGDTPEPLLSRIPELPDGK